MLMKLSYKMYYCYHNWFIFRKIKFYCMYRYISKPYTIKFPYRISNFNFRRNTELTAESIKHLEKVFRENLAKDKDEFTLSEFKRIVPSKNVS